MPKYGFMISKAVDLVARKLAGMDSETVARLTQVLSEEAQMISEELQYSGENVNADMIAARLEGLVARMKYEVRNQGPDPSPHEFPIFNVSHNPQAPYPNPINHLYDKRYKEAYSTFIKQNQPPPSSTSTSQKSEPSTPTSPQPPIINPNSSSYSNYSQGQSQQQMPKPPSQSSGSAPPFRQQPPGGWQYVNPYATMPRSHAAYYQQQASKVMPTIQEQPVRRSSTGEDMRPHSLSRSASSNDLNYSTNPGTEKIRVRVINDNSGSSSSSNIDPQLNPNNRSYGQRSILKPNNDTNDNQDIITRRIYASPNTDIGAETLQDLFKVVNKQRSEPPGSAPSPMTERVIIIDRRGAATPDNNSNASGVDRVRTFEIRSTPGAPTPTPTPTSPTTPTAPTISTPVAKNNSSSAAYAMRQPNYYAGQQFYYQQPKMYSSVPGNFYATTPYVSGINNFYPFGYFPY